MAEMGIKEVETYVSRHHNTFTQFIVTRPIIDLWLASMRRLGERVLNWWWYQDFMELGRIHMAACMEDLELEETEGYETGG